jgi:dTDP-4-dehydrorhamnose 3,5-epimerase
VRFGRLERHADERGSFRELWRESAFGDLAAAGTGRQGARFVQANVSSSNAGVLRGLHYHRRQLDYWVVAAGRVFVALVDVRPVLANPSASPGLETRELGENEWVVIPSGVAHGFCAIQATDLLYLVTNEYDGTDELGFAWDDPEVGVAWPVREPILSARDRSNPTLRELVRLLG